jgi:hypothetical protein
MDTSPTNLPAVTLSRFDYSSLDATVADEARTAAMRIKERYHGFKNGLLEVGRDLLMIKEKLGHGNFGNWIKAEFTMTDRSAQNLMNAARFANANSEIVSVMPLKAIYMLAAPSTPDAVRKEIVGKLEKGERPAMSEIKKQIALVKKEEAQAAREARALSAKSEKQDSDGNKLGEQEEQLRQEQDDHEREENECIESANDAAVLVRARLGTDFECFMGLYRKGYCYFDSALREIATVPGTLNKVAPVLELTAEEADTEPRPGTLMLAQLELPVAA